MKVCGQCGQVVAESVHTCPACGAEVAAGRAAIDDFHILEVLHEGYSSTLCKAQREGEDTPVMIRIFTPQSGVDAHLAERLKHELEELQALPDDYFVRHLAIRQSSDGLWYRISEWVDALNWGTLLSTGRLKDASTALHLFGQITAILDGLHRIGHIIPHLILDDILVSEGAEGAYKVKIDYKLSRFLDPQLDRPGPMLARLLAMHPDIVNQRPLDRHSDIWSLGKIFVEILCADPAGGDLHGRVDTLPVPREVRTLIRLMLSNNPELRPRSMAEVAATLGRLDDKAIRAAQRQADMRLQAPQALLHRINVRMALMAALLITIIAVGGMLWLRLDPLREDSEAALIGYANAYAGSVAFVVVDYWLEMGNRTVYRNRTEGTAFLADHQGHLLTNRHVACPWLEDRRLMGLIGLLGRRPERLHFDYRVFLWFDGERAFRRLPALGDSDAVEDIYVTESAFSSQGKQRVWIAGVAPAPEKTRERVRSPLRDDFAVLKIDPVPTGRKPLPLAKEFRATSIPKLTPLITLGFPLGGKTQAESVNVSVTQGHVRRTFENMFQVDTSLHPGNSGGPFIDQKGRVVGLATIVAVAMARGPVPVATPLSDIGLVLPITQAAVFLDQIRAGQTKWNGEIDVNLERRLQAIMETARRREWEQARDIAGRALAARRTPTLLMAAAVMHLCTGDLAASRRLFDQVLSMEPQRNMARLMILLSEWLEGRQLAADSRQALMALDWRSPDEFMGYLATILAGEIPAAGAIDGGYSQAEKSWLHLVAGMIAQRNESLDAAWPLFETAALNADIDDWSLYLALAQLDRIQRCAMEKPAEGSACIKFRNRLEAFEDRLDRSLAARQELRARKAPIQSKFQRGEIDLKTQRELLKTLYDMDRGNSRILVARSYYAAMDEDWGAALDISRQFLALPGRASAGKLGLGLLEPQILNMQGRADLARAGLEAYQRSVADPWYRALSACLLDPRRQPEISAKAAENPENLLTGHTALGLWAEGSGDTAGAISHYKEALMSYADYRLEYDFALGRVKRLQQTLR